MQSSIHEGSLGLGTSRKGLVWAWSEKEKELWTVKVMKMKMNWQGWNVVSVSAIDQHAMILTKCSSSSKLFPELHNEMID